MPTGRIDPTLMDIFRTVLNEQRSTKPPSDDNARVVVRGNGNYIALGGGLHVARNPSRPVKQRPIRRPA